MSLNSMELHVKVHYVAGLRNGQDLRLDPSVTGISIHIYGSAAYARGPDNHMEKAPMHGRGFAQEHKLSPRRIGQRLPILRECETGLSQTDVLRMRVSANGLNASWKTVVQYRSSGDAPRITTTLFVCGSSWSMSSTSSVRSTSRTHRRSRTFSRSSSRRGSTKRRSREPEPRLLRIVAVTSLAHGRPRHKLVNKNERAPEGALSFAEPISLSSTALADPRLPPYAFKIGFDLVTLRTRRARESRSFETRAQGSARRKSPQIGLATQS